MRIGEKKNSERRVGEVLKENKERGKEEERKEKHKTKRGTVSRRGFEKKKKRVYEIWSRL